MKNPTNKEIRACDGSILNIAPAANSQKIAVAKKIVKAKPATIKLVLKSLKNTSFFFMYWDEKEYEEFKTFLSLNPNAGDVEPNSGGIRKVRWTSGGRGKSSGVRVIYFNRLENGEIWLLTLYSKKETTQLSKKTLQLLVEKLNDSFNG